MLKALSVVFFLLASTSFSNVCCQKAVTLTGKVLNPEFDKKIASLIDFSCPILSVKEARRIPNAVFLDAREPAEYAVSHIPGALPIGYDHWDDHVVNKFSKDQVLMVYCSVGYRSEKIANELIKKGFKRVFNLYGSLFEWANEGYTLVDPENKPTLKIHTYNKNWSKWVTNPDLVKVW